MRLALGTEEIKHVSVVVDDSQKRDERETSKRKRRIGGGLVKVEKEEGRDVRFEEEPGVCIRNVVHKSHHPIPDPARAPLPARPPDRPQARTSLFVRSAFVRRSAVESTTKKKKQHRASICARALSFSLPYSGLSFSRLRVRNMAWHGICAVERRNEERGARSWEGGLKDGWRHAWFNSRVACCWSSTRVV